jgi:hypothetical protein
MATTSHHIAAIRAAARAFAQEHPDVSPRLEQEADLVEERSRGDLAKAAERCREQMEKCDDSATLASLEKAAISCEAEMLAETNPAAAAQYRRDHRHRLAA